MDLRITPAKQIYFLSDFHLGAPDSKSSLEREKRIVEFLNEAKKDAQHIFIVGDMFDFWYEYKKVVPKGYVRLLGKLAEITDSGIKLHFFVGNHDMWMKDYFQRELNIQVYFEPHEFVFNEKKFFIAHGDGLGPGDKGYKLIKKIFRNRFSRALFGLLPPFIGIGLAHFLSRRSRASTGAVDEQFLGEEKEWLIMYCKDVLKHRNYDYLIFGHRHLPVEFALNSNSKYINLGDWIRYYTYATFDGHNLKLKSRYPELENKIIRK